jgi:tRNA-specific 2-thiouridylase
VLGQHLGLSFYTLGQRQGLGIGGVKGGDKAAADGHHDAWYVAAKDLQHNVLRVVQGHEHPALLAPRLVAQDCSWVAGHPPATGRLAAKTRYRQADAACCFEPTAEGFALAFDHPQWAVTPGQSAVLYDGEVCLGGGVIDSAEVLRPLPAVAPQPPARPKAARRAKVPQ